MKNFITLTWNSQALLVLITWLLPLSWVRAQAITNGGFNTNVSCSTAPANTNTPFDAGCIAGWSASHGRPRVGYSLPQTSLALAANKQGYSDGVFTRLSLAANQFYQLTYYSYGFNGAGDAAPSQVVFALTDNLTAGSTASGSFPVPFPTPYIEIARQDVPYSTSGSWNQYTITFTTPNWSNTPQLWLYAQLSSTARTQASYEVGVDSITISPSCASTDIYYQNTSSLPLSTRTKGKIYAGTNRGPNTPGPVAVLASQTVSFRSLSLIGLEEGFSVESGSTFEAITIACPGFNPFTGEDTDSPNATDCACGPCDCLRYYAKGAESTDASASARIGNIVPSSKLADSTTSNEAALFPNPTAGRLEFYPGKSALEHSGYFTVYDATGREVKMIACQQATWQNDNIMLDMSSLDNGLYHYRFVSGDYFVSGRFSIQK